MFYINFKKFTIFSGVIILSVVFVGLLFNPIIGNFHSFVMPKISLTPLVSSLWFSLVITGTYIFSVILPKIDPLKPDFKSFSNLYYRQVLVAEILVLFLFVLDVINYFYNINIPTFLSLGFAVLFWVSGDLFFKVKRSWFLGMRTPWTLHSDLVFEKTNYLAGKLFKVTAVFSFLGFLVGNFCLYFAVVPLFFTVIIVFFYSYFIYHKQKSI